MTFSFNSVIEYCRMAGNSDFTLRWEIDNARAALANKKITSDVFNEGGFRWTAAAKSIYSHNYGDSEAQFSLSCSPDIDGPFKVDTEVAVYAQRQTGFLNPIPKVRVCFNNENGTIVLPRGNRLTWLNLIESYLVSNKLTLEFRIHIIYSESVKPIVRRSGVFSSSNRMSNVILAIGDKKIHVCKEYLAVHSPIFETLFFGNYAEKGKEEVEIKDVNYEEFLDLLHVIYVEDVQITDSTVHHILKLADQFQMERVLNLSKNHLSQTRGIDVVKKLHLADQYRLTALREVCLKSFTRVDDIVAKIKKSTEYAKFSSDMKAAICDRIMEI